MNARPGISMTEAQLQYSCVRLLHQCAGPDVLYCHVPNEGKRTTGQQIHQWKMGLLPGWPDFQLFKDGKPHFIEFKVGNASLSEAQERVREKAEAQGIPYAVVRSPERFHEVMKQWGMLRNAD